MSFLGSDNHDLRYSKDGEFGNSFKTAIRFIVGRWICVCVWGPERGRGKSKSVLGTFRNLFLDGGRCLRAGAPDRIRERRFHTWYYKHVINSTFMNSTQWVRVFSETLCSAFSMQSNSCCQALNFASVSWTWVYMRSLAEPSQMLVEFIKVEFIKCLWYCFFQTMNTLQLIRGLTILWPPLKVW